ncbi:MAG: HDOD domain-containing protein [Planctomycetes bacterium]|nr:HDOD domain-containing protein [Planctomycetota bacterium]
MGLTGTTFQEIVDRVHTIPSLPEVVTKVVSMVNDPNSGAEEVGHIMSKDPAMAAKILCLVNSAYYGMPEPVSSLDQAIVILGFKTIRSIALSVSVINLFQQADTGFNLKAYWTHSSVSACICRLIAEKVGTVDPEISFVVGLLKDIGLMIMLENASDETKAIIAVAREYKLGLHTASHKVMQTDHAEIGAWLCEHWGLEDSITHAVRNQFDVNLANDNLYIAIAQFSEYLCGLKKIRLSGDCNEPGIDAVIWEYLDMGKKDLVDILAVINDEVDRAKELLSAAA